MADPYWGYPVDRDPRSAFPGFLSSENSGLTSHGFSGSSELYGGASDHLQRDAIENRARSAFSGFPGASVRPFTPLEDPALARREAMLDVKPGMTDIEHSSSLRKDEGLPKEWPGILFVDGLPNDCTRREAARILFLLSINHFKSAKNRSSIFSCVNIVDSSLSPSADLFRPFIGFKDIKVFHKEPRRSGDKARVLCFVEFTDAKCASTAMEALQGYKFDDKKPDAPVLRIQFAQFPFHPPAHN